MGSNIATTIPCHETADKPLCRGVFQVGAESVARTRNPEVQISCIIARWHCEHMPWLKRTRSR